MGLRNWLKELGEDLVGGSLEADWQDIKRNPGRYTESYIARILYDYLGHPDDEKSLDYIHQQAKKYGKG